MRKMLADGDPVTVEAKYMDYRFCCASPSNPASCHIETGGDNVTKLHAGYRKVNYWVSQYTGERRLQRGVFFLVSLFFHAAPCCVVVKILRTWAPPRATFWNATRRGCASRGKWWRTPSLKSFTRC